MLKHYAKLFGKAVLLVIMSSLIGLFLILVVYTIPTDRIEANVKSSANIFVNEGVYPVSRSIFGKDSLDNFTDALMLLNAAYSGDENLIEKSVLVKRAYIKGKNPKDVLTSKYVKNEQVTYVSYARYWHGYLILLKPLLYVFTYGQIRTINFYLVMLAAGLLVFLMYKKEMSRYIIPFMLSWFLINPIAIGQSLQYSSVYYIYTIASIVFLVNKEKILASEKKTLCFFVVIGCFTSYFDLLTYPLVTFGIPITFYVCASEGKCKEVFKIVVLALVAWSIGYIGMWAGKWIFGSLFSNQNVLANAFKQILYRSSMENNNVAFSAVKVIHRNLLRLQGIKIALPAVHILALVFSLFAKANKENTKLKKEDINDYLWIVLVFICLLPFGWYVGASNHSYIHPVFTYRELMITIFAGMCIFARYTTKNLKLKLM